MESQTDFHVIFTTNTPAEISEAYQDVKSRGGSFDDMIEALSKYQECAPSIVRYLYAQYHHENGNDSEASKIITFVLKHLDSTQDYVLELIPSNLARIFGLAGEIYANNNQLSESKTAFEDYQLCLCRLKGVEDNTPLLSFRKFNEYSLSDLINNEITVCSPRVMNDPYDTLLLEWGNNMKKSNHKPHVGPLCDSIEAYRIRSFSRIVNNEGMDMVSNVLMWSHYADQHNGFCIQYKFSDSFIKTTEDRRTVRLHKIDYQPEDKPLDITSGTINTQIALCTKQQQWAYENEVRLIACEPDVVRPYHSIPLDRDSRIEKVFFGYRCPDRNIETIKKILAMQEGIRFYKMQSTPEDIYHLNSIEIP